MRRANPSDEGDNDHTAAMFWCLLGLCRNDQHAQKQQTCDSGKCRSDSVLQVTREEQSHLNLSTLVESSSNSEYLQIFYSEIRKSEYCHM